MERRKDTGGVHILEGGGGQGGRGIAAQDSESCHKMQ